MGNYDIGQFILYMVALIFSLSVHESAHAWMSNRFGDDLARLQGRISLNPAAHVDPIGTLLFPAISFFTHAPLIGWARPTPVNPLKWRNKNVANFWVSAAGVICNFIIAIVAGITIRVLYETGTIANARGIPIRFLYELGAMARVGDMLVPATTDSLIAVGAIKLLVTFFTLNVGLGVFNLLPIPPLDGGSILSSILPDSFGSALDALNQFGFILLFIAAFTGILSVIFSVVMPIAWGLVFIGAS